MLVILIEKEYSYINNHWVLQSSCWAYLAGGSMKSFSVRPMTVGLGHGSFMQLYEMTAAVGTMEESPLSAVALKVFSPPGSSALAGAP